MANIADMQVVVVLPYYEARAARTAAAREAKDKRRKAEHRPFIPGPGKIDTNIARAETLESSAAKIDAALDIAIDDWKKAHPNAEV